MSRSDDSWPGRRRTSIQCALLHRDGLTACPRGAIGVLLARLPRCIQNAVVIEALVVDTTAHFDVIAWARVRLMPVETLNDPSALETPHSIPRQPGHGAQPRSSSSRQTRVVSISRHHCAPSSQQA